MMKTEAILFDLDGTLLNTIQDLTDCVNHSLNKMGMPMRSIFEVRKFIGDGLKMLLTRAMPVGSTQEMYEEILKIYKPYYQEHMQDKTVPFDGIMDLLKALKEKDIKIAVVSNKQDEAVKALCADVFGNLVDIAIGVGNGVEPKPDPGAVFEAVKQLNVNPENIYYVGDSFIDMQVSENAKVKSVAVSWGYCDREVFDNYSPTLIADKPSDILNLL